MKTTERDVLMEILEKKYSKLFLNTTEQFDGSKGGIWTSGEGGDCAKDEFKLFDYYAEDYKEVRYVMGVHKEIGDLLDEHGWYAEWQDAGTIMLWKI